jgi:hypothetical protein
MKMIIIALAVWALKSWIEHDPSQQPEPSEGEARPLEAEDWYLYGV